ncbi:MAG: tRNA-intron lyase [Hadesarchaea archaeon]|nr:MAG: tRNA-intron lyase [Hadesarchaea archaeon]HDI13114.1 tRNA-intron lyase [Hadesarchaea archaeon]
MEAEIPVIEAQLYKGKVMVWDEAQANQLYQRGSYGKPLSGGKLQLAYVEALYLVEGGKLHVIDENGRQLKFKELLEKFTVSDPEVTLKYTVYSDLRSRGYIVKTGLKFGAHFRVYDRGERPGEAHSKFLVHAVPEGIKLTPTEIARAVRLAHSVRKKILWAVVDDEGDITYYSLTRERP